MLVLTKIVDGKRDGQTEIRTPILHLAKAGVTNMLHMKFEIYGCSGLREQVI